MEKKETAFDLMQEFMLDYLDGDLTQGDFYKDFKPLGVGEEQVRKMIKAHNKKPHLKQHRTFTIVAAATCILLLASLIGMTIHFGSVSAVRDKVRQIITLFDGAAVINNTGNIGPSSVDNYPERSMVFTTPDTISKAKKAYPDLCMVGYITEGYQFENLTYLQKENFTSFEYIYRNEAQDSIVISQVAKGGDNTPTQKILHEISIGDNVVKIFKGSEIGTAIFKQGKYVYTISGVNEVELIMIIENLTF